MAGPIVAKMIVSFQARIMFDEMALRLGIERSEVLKWGLCILYEIVCLYPSNESWRVFARNRYTGEVCIFDPVKDFQSRAIDPRAEAFAVDSTVQLELDEEAQHFACELMIRFNDDIGYVFRLSLGLLTSILMRYRISEGWEFLADHQEFPGEELPLETCKALAA